MIKIKKRSSIFKAVCAIALAVAAGNVTSTAQSFEPKTVTDFFLLVPDRYMADYDRRFREEILRSERRGAVIDVPNGYISWDASDNPEGFELAIFKKKNGRYIVAYSTGAYGDPQLDRELGNWPAFFLLSYEKGKWRDVTSRLLPVPFDKQLYHKLPRQGRSIEVWDASGRKAYTLTWRNDRFQISRSGR